MKHTGIFLVGLLIGAVGITWLTNNQFLGLWTNDSLWALTIRDSSAQDSGMVLDTAKAARVMKDIYEILRDNHFDESAVNPEKMTDNALKGFVDGLADPYTTYLTTEETQLFDEEMKGSQNFEWIGAVVTKKEDGVLVEEVLKGSPAYTAWIKPLDLILQINGEAVGNLDLNEAVQKIRGPKGTEVILTIFRPEGGTGLQDIPVIRDVVNVPSVEIETIERNGKRLLHMNISIFGDDTVKTMLQALRDHPVRDGIIVDVRGNGGGYLPVAVDIASYFVPKGELVVTSKYRRYEDNRFESQWFPELQDIPVVVLVDELSASASEVLAAALRSHLKAPLVGKQTFGKGSIQTVYPIKDGLLKFTLGKRYTPEGENVDEVGLKPDVEVDFDASALPGSGVDTQLDSAVEELSKLLAN